MNKERAYDDAEFIHVYTAQEAVEDGVLIEIDPELTQEAGYRIPVRITQGVSALVTPSQSEEKEGQSAQGRVWDLLWLARVAIANSERSESVVPFDAAIGGKAERLWACLDGTSGPAIHIIKPEEY
jgi:hypothetical protein